VERYVHRFALAIGILNVGCGAEEALESSNNRNDRIDLGGSVGAMRVFARDGAVETALVASFESIPTDSCYSRSVDSCVIKRCPISFRIDEPVRTTAANAARVEVISSEGELSAAPHADGRYRSVFSPGSLWSVGEPISVRAEGNAIPAFDVLLAGPDAPIVVEPARTISRRQGFMLQWIAAELGEVMLVLNQMQGHDSLTISCRFEAGLGSGVVPSSILDELDNGGLSISVGTIEQQTVNAGRWAIDVFAFASALSRFIQFTN
jgi:hypothetical protein